MDINMSITEILWKADNEDGTYSNPILYTDYSDPDVIRVGDTFYMTASSFNYMPGLPILTSKDLVNWKLVNYAVKNLPYKKYDMPQMSNGIWAPCIRYHDGKFWIFVGMPDEGIFMTCTENPLGEWSPLHLVREAKGFIDPTPFWDEDGKAYVIHAYAKSRCGINSKLGIFEISSDGKETISDDKIIFDGTETQPTIEGPKAYKRDGYYYILAPAGGVDYGWQTALRSRSIYGPYEEKQVCKQGTTRINGPHQGGLVDTLEGTEWFIHFQATGTYGRILNLEPVTWKDGWPIIGVDIDNDGIGEPVETYQKPVQGGEVLPCIGSDYFKEKELHPNWQWQANWKNEFYALGEQGLCLFARNDTGKRNGYLNTFPNILTEKLMCREFRADFYMDFSGLKENEEAGIIVLAGEYGALSVKREEDCFSIYSIRSVPGESDGTEKATLGEQNTKLAELPTERAQLQLRIDFHEDGTNDFVWITGAKETVAVENYSSGGAHWVGSKIGMFAVNRSVENAADNSQTGAVVIKKVIVTRCTPARHKTDL